MTLPDALTDLLNNPFTSCIAGAGSCLRRFREGLLANWIPIISSCKDNQEVQGQNNTFLPSSGFGFACLLEILDEKKKFVDISDDKARFSRFTAPPICTSKEERDKTKLTGQAFYET